MGIWQDVIMLAGNVIRVYSVKKFIDLFMKNTEYRGKHQMILYVFLWFGSWGVYKIFHMPIITMIGNLFFLFLILWFYQTSFIKKIFLTVFIQGVFCAIDSLVVYSFYTATGRQIVPYSDGFSGLILLIIVLLWEQTPLKKKEVELPRKYVASIAMVPIISLSIITVLVLQDVWEDYLPWLILGVLLFTVLIFYQYYFIEKFYLAYLEKKEMEQFISSYCYQAEVIEESQRRIQSFRHDMKHHIAALDAMAQTGRNEEISQYLGEMKEYMLNPKEYVATGNMKLDGFLNYMLEKTQNVLRNPKISIQLPEGGFQEDFSFCVILGNLLENAIREAAHSEEKFLELYISAGQGILRMKIANSYCERKEETKEEWKSHGIGLKNVRKMVEKNQGEMLIQKEEHIFQVKVMLYLPKTQSENK